MHVAAAAPSNDSLPLVTARVRFGQKSGTYDCAMAAGIDVQRSARARLNATNDWQNACSSGSTPLSRLAEPPLALLFPPPLPPLLPLVDASLLPHPVAPHSAAKTAANSWTLLPIESLMARAYPKCSRAPNPNSSPRTTRDAWTSRGRWRLGRAPSCVLGRVLGTFSARSRRILAAFWPRSGRVLGWSLACNCGFFSLMLTLVNSNRLLPPIAPIGLDYIGSAARAAGIETELLDWGQSEDRQALLESYFRSRTPELIGISFRNVDDCFWPSCQSYVHELAELVRGLRRLSDAPIVVGGVGFSIFARRLTAACGADFGIRGDGEDAVIALYRELQGQREWHRVPGLCWLRREEWVCNPPSWPERLDHVRSRDFVDNHQYYLRGGQAGIESKRGCPRRCIYCADPVAKGRHVRYRSPAAVADEAAALWTQGVEVLHFCDGEFNVPRAHALAVCEALTQRGLGSKIRFYIYATVRPFDAELAGKLRAAGCVGVNFTGDSAHPQVLRSYCVAHRREHLEQAVHACRRAGITCMVDLLLGGPGETPETLQYTIETLRAIGPDCVGAGLGMRLYPETPVLPVLLKQGPLETNAGIRRHYAGPIDLVWPTFYVSPALGTTPARLVRELVGADARFFAPADDSGGPSTDHNYSDNRGLSQAIAQGARGAYWDLLRPRY